MADNDNKLWMLDAPYILFIADKREFLKTLRSIKIPYCFVSNLHIRIYDSKSCGIKFHDYQILMQQILLVRLKNVGDEKVPRAVIRLSRIFQHLYSKVVDPYLNL